MMPGDAPRGEPVASTGRAQANAALLAALTTEHGALQNARSSTVFETNGRMAQYLSVVSGTVIALAFIGQVSVLGDAFFAFALTALPALCVLGLLTFQRCVDSATEDLFSALAIARIRQYYQQIAPDAGRYLLLSGHDDPAGVLQNMGLALTRWPLLSHSSTMVLAVTAMIGGVFTALGAVAAVDATVASSAACGVVVASASAVGLYWHQSRHWRTATANVGARLPTAPPRA